MSDQSAFIEELESLILKHGIGEETDTPPPILAKYIQKQIRTYHDSVLIRAAYFLSNPEPVLDSAYDG